MTTQHQTSAQALAADPDGLDLTNCLLLDVRRAAVFEHAATMLPGAQWRDPARVSDWAGELPRDRDVVVYCVHGHEVSQSTAQQLRACGVQARFLTGGIEAWMQAGRAVQPREKEA